MGNKVDFTESDELHLQVGKLADGDMAVVVSTGEIIFRTSGEVYRLEDFEAPYRDLDRQEKCKLLVDVHLAINAKCARNMWEVS